MIYRVGCQGYNGGVYKLIILVESTSEPGFHNFWPRFLHAAESIPGLHREATARISQVLYGDAQYALVHELYFDSLPALQAGLASPSGKEAGRLLQEMTGGRVKLLIADHSEDELENIRKYKKLEQDANRQAGHA
jgi:uncharacterized protein (TIGR02118 family)